MLLTIVAVVTTISCVGRLCNRVPIKVDSFIHVPSHVINSVVTLNGLMLKGKKEQERHQLLTMVPLVMMNQLLRKELHRHVVCVIYLDIIKDLVLI